MLSTLEIDEGREREKHHCERNIDGLPPTSILTGYRTHNLGMCLDLGWNSQLLVYGITR